MKKIISTILFLAVTAVYAQSFQISYNGEQVGESLDFIATEPDDDNELVIILTNDSEAVDSIFLMKRVIEEVPGSSNVFCIGGLCTEPDITASSSPMILQPGESSNSGTFHLLYNPGGAEGTTVVAYTFRSGDFIKSLTVNYIYRSVGIEEADICVNSLTAYPNPATSSVTVAYDLSGLRAGNTRLIITNLVGSKVAVRPINGTSGKVSMDLSNLDSGIYFYSIEADGKIVSTKKLIVK